MEKIKRRQRLLAFLQGDDGRFYYDGPVDGIDGKSTREGAERFLKDYGFKEAAKDNNVPGKSSYDGIKYFTHTECKCRCKGKYCDCTREPEHRLLEVADEIREDIDAPLIPTSVIRCETWNSLQPGAAKDSLHKRGLAMDAWTPGMSAKDLLDAVKKNPKVRYAYAVDQNVVHFDVE